MRKLLRILDANANRCREGLRVCEDIARFALCDKKITASFKALRHAVTAGIKKLESRAVVLSDARNAGRDIGKKITSAERDRKNINDIFLANMERSKESLRVLEEVSKLFNVKISSYFKKIRFRLYGIEKRSKKKLGSLLHTG